MLRLVHQTKLLVSQHCHVCENYFSRNLFYSTINIWATNLMKIDGIRSMHEEGEEIYGKSSLTNYRIHFGDPVVDGPR